MFSARGASELGTSDQTRNRQMKFAAEGERVERWVLAKGDSRRHVPRHTRQSNVRQNRGRNRAWIPGRHQDKGRDEEGCGITETRITAAVHTHQPLWSLRRSPLTCSCPQHDPCSGCMRSCRAKRIQKTR